LQLAAERDGNECFPHACRTKKPECAMGAVLNPVDEPVNHQIAGARHTTYVLWLLVVCGFMSTSLVKSYSKLC